MSANSLNNNTQQNNPYTATAGAGAIAGGLGTYGVINTRLKNIANNTVKALDKPSAAGDAFIRKHDDLITRAVESKRGFFGKINKALKGVTGPDNIQNSVNTNTNAVIDGYRDKAAKKIGAKLSGQQLENKINETANKYLSKDILKSFKNVNKYQNILMVSAAVVLGAIGACAVKEVASRGSLKSGEKTPEITEKTDAGEKKSSEKPETKTKKAATNA